MSKLNSVKLVADIVEVGSRVYGTVIDKLLAQRNADKDEKIKQLEKERDELKRKLDSDEK